VTQSNPTVPSFVRTYGTWAHQQTIIAGPGAVVAALGDEVRRLGAERVFLLTTPSLVREGTLLDTVRAALGDALVGEFDACRAHNPRPVVLEAARQVREARPDLLVTFGGSTVTDAGKAVSFTIANGIHEPGDFDAVDPAASAADPAVRAALIPYIAIPTTLSGAEYSAAAGITNVETKLKRVYPQPGNQPATVVLDPDVTVATPERLWCSTGVKSMSDSIEMMCSPASHPFVRVLARAAAESFFRDLPESFSDDAEVRVQARSACQHAAWMSAYSLSNSTSKLGLGNSLRHQLGAMGVGHGEATCIMLPHVLAFNWPALGDVQDDVATALALGGDAPVSAATVQERVRSFVASLGLPGALREVGVAESDLPDLAPRVLNDGMTPFNPKPVSLEDIEALLRAAY
jgi:maleylacetate reductase